MKQPTTLRGFAALQPDKPAVIEAETGLAISYRELDERSNRLSRLLHAQGLRRGDRFAMVMENHLRCFEVAWAALRSGLLLVTVNRYLTPAEAAYIVNDSDARVVVSSRAMAELAGPLTALMPAVERRLMVDSAVDGAVDSAIDGWEPYEDAVAAFAPTPLDEEWLGGLMFYSSGTTGQPKGVVRALAAVPPDDAAAHALRVLMPRRFGFDGDTVYLSTAPLYHAAPMSYATNVHVLGGTTVFMRRFEPLAALAAIERWRVTHSQWVPTMFIRLLKLDEQQRHGFDLGSHRAAIHAAAPCPPEVKRRMIDWWGPIVGEYYGGSEANGITVIDSAEALQRPGSVGRALLGTLRICDESGAELPAGQDGLIYFERDALPFHYHKDEAKTRAAQHPQHPNWTTIGDIGHVDADGFLYLTDRASFMIISGGVNIYPQAVENALALHPAVADVAVIGVPDDEMGEAVKAIVEPADGVLPSPELAAAIVDFLRGKVARYMLPKSVDFIDRMPRLPTGKLYKKALRERYAARAAA
ncbi:MAG: acyl-CoA synthetase [Proteobacteria bacterium]|nr:acyl-CoA synthetase [Pseudomonadota bacterium]